MTRYVRQQLVPGVGLEGQEILSSARVLVAGAGGLGVPVLQYLAGAGVGYITLVDPDVVAEHNLHRQPLYGMSDIGRPKAVAAADALNRLNPEVSVLPVTQWLDSLTAAELLEGCDIALDCGDNFAVSYTLSDYCLASGRPLISASALGTEGFVAGYCGGAPSMRAVFPELPGEAGSCATAGIMGPVVAALGALQAQMALAVLLGIEPSPLGTMLTLDARNWRTSAFRFHDAPEPAGPLLRFVSAAAVTPEDLAIDLRGEVEAPETVVPHAVRMRVEDLAAGLQVPAGTARVAICCSTGVRAWAAARSLQAIWPGEVVVVAAGDSQHMPGTGCE